MTRRTATAVATEEVLALFEDRGGHHYGEVIDQRSHALQCADEAQHRGADAALVIACLLHDIGHLLADPSDDGWDDHSLEDDHHEAVGARWLAPRFGPAVARSVALHVVAKRWRCTVDSEYHDALSPASQATLLTQGGPLSQIEVTRFQQSPGFAPAVFLRDCDEAAKDPCRPVGDLDSYVEMLESQAQSAAFAGASRAWTGTPTP